MDTPFETLEVLISSRSEKDEFKVGRLRDEWAVRYPMIFDEHEYRTVCNQPGGHFHEWRTAAHLYETRGQLSLIEAYRFKNNLWKRHVVKRLGAQALLEFFDTQRSRGFGNMHPPDLLVYAPDYSDYYFCEAK